MVDYLKALLPERLVPWVVAVLMLVWMGWKTNEVYSVVHRHYLETTGTRHIAHESCKAVKALAKQNPNDCDYVVERE